MAPTTISFYSLQTLFPFLSIGIAYTAGKVSRVVAHPAPLNDEEWGDLDCRSHTRRMYRLSLLLSYMAHFVCSGDANGKKGDQVLSMVILSGTSIVVLQCLGGHGRRCQQGLWFMFCHGDSCLANRVSPALAQRSCELWKVTVVKQLNSQPCELAR